MPLRPSVGSQVVREYVYAYVAVCPQDGQMTSMILPWVDAKLMSIFCVLVAGVRDSCRQWRPCHGLRLNWGHYASSPRPSRVAA